MDPLRNILPERGWLRDYVEFGSGLEVCTRFLFFAGACVLGASINNKAWIQRGDPDLLPKLFPNLWVLLLAPPGRGHKTSTINMAVNCLYQAGPDTRVLADKLTPESLVKALSEPTVKEKIRIGPRDATGLVKAPELSVFFGKQQYNTGLVSLVTDLYDYRDEWSSETIMRGKAVLRRNCISVLGGSTPDWLQTMLPQDAFTGGFMSRFVIVEMPPTYLKRRAFPQRESQITWKELVSELRAIGGMKGEFTWTKEAQEAYQKYYESLTPTGDVQKDAYQERESEQILKLGMLLAVSEESFQVEARHLSKARMLLETLLQETQPRIERLTTHPRMVLVQEIQDILRQHNGKLTKKQMLKKVYRGLAYGEAQFAEAVRVLHQAGVVKSEGDAMNPTLVLVRDVKQRPLGGYQDE